MRLSNLLAVAAALLGADVHAEVAKLPLPKSCSGVPNMRYQYTINPAWTVMKIAGSLKQVRTIIWDTEGNMLVQQNTRGVSVHTFGADGCINSTNMLISGGGLNHGLDLTPDGKTLYASSETTLYSWAYDPLTRKVSNQKTVVKDMSTGVHSSRTVKVVPGQPNLVLLQVGSNSNLDMAAQQPSTGRACIKVFDVNKVPSGGYNYNTQGEMFGFGLRNEIGFVPDPNGVFWGVENSGDDFTRTENGQRRDIHTNNPAEKLNNLGDPRTVRNAWYGYPTCFSVWDPSSFTNSLKTGQHFVIAPNTSYNDATCNGKAIAPRLTFQAHSAPIWNTFDDEAKNIWDPAGRGLFVGSDNSAEGEIYILSPKS
ncbi:hypothetical protein NEUTE1DRAFT_98738 [Neurospora tetrasperma FGSC 2508]|uniref:Pyrroloquinoline quinone-dependent pyranose dehydrogenase beta-propeller domain-containing protein n=1 Tax=Neurospora tetrasperma (strain FGSC 2508 / ATCC MYA-4615 / P0657) TaxID=510951 RepID=F8MEN0_NEUT8|nr:uncharacterized protein NEUTE1DRAFT_98738 [Neurospora tetrasperma FGSC 2508]EGO61659.1 hypothetical protein NEUTE1DRAFT_98738 [Neurospora tetrasperma FGSC 2508]